MDWIAFLQIVCAPTFGWFFYQLGKIKKDIEETNHNLNTFKVKVAEKYSSKEEINKLEVKLDEIHGLIIDAIRKGDIK